MRVLVKALFRHGNPYLVKDLDGPFYSLFLVHILMQLHSFRNLMANCVNRGKGSQRLLENHGNLVAADAANQIAIGVYLG